MHIRCNSLGDRPRFISSSSASSGRSDRVCPVPNLGDVPSSMCCCGLVFRRRQQMARSAVTRARPTMPPATPPAIAALFDFEAGISVVTADGPAADIVGLLGAEVEARKLPMLVDVDNDTKLLASWLLVEEDVVLKIGALIVLRKSTKGMSVERRL